MKIKFIFEYETEKSVRFNEAEEPHKVGSIYIKKWVWEKELKKAEEIYLEVSLT